MARAARLLDAIRTNDAAAVAAALGPKADPGRPIGGVLPLVEAARCADPPVLDLLLGRGADIDQREGEDETATTALAAACLRGRAAVVTFLLGRGAGVNVEMEGRTALSAATSDRDAGRTGIVRALLDAGADPAAVFRSAAGVEVDDVLMRASQSGSAAAVELMIRAGAPVNRPLFFGTPLTEAAAEGRADVVAVLLKHGADPSLRATADPRLGDVAGLTPREIAVRKRRRKVVEVLDRHAAAR